MPPTVAELLRAIPDETVVEERQNASEELRALYERLEKRSIPTGAIHRFWKLSGLQARIGFAYAAYWIKGWYQTQDQRQADLLETHLSAAMKLLETMGFMRGAVMKVGQILASFPDIVPDEFVKSLGHLHFQAPAMHYSLIREQLIDELGDDPADVFSSFETEAFAAASLGQVHRARLKSGEPVAVKIQYPGIARTIRSDFRVLLALMSPLRLSNDWSNLRDQMTEIESTLKRETDYEQEAEFLRMARSLFSEEDGVIVPRVYDRYSTRRVLTMEYIDGRVTPEFLATKPSQELRDASSEKIYRAGCRLTAQRRMYYSDMHPGNFIFREDGSVGMIDFGGVRVLDDDEWEYLRLSQDSRVGTRDDVLSHIQRSLLLSDERMQKIPELIDVMVEFCDYYWQPLRQEGPFDFSDPEYLRRGFDLMARTARHRHSRQRPVNLYMHRASFELAALFYQLKSRFDCKAIWDDEKRATGWE